MAAKHKYTDAGKSEYKYVRKFKDEAGNILIAATVPALRKFQWCSTERLAAIQVDCWFIEVGKEPKNILKSAKNLKK